MIRSLTSRRESKTGDEESALLEWIQGRNADVDVAVSAIPFREMNSWCFDPVSGNLVHESGKFFSIAGLDVFVNNGQEIRWNQPVVNQPEVGYLGILAKEFDGSVHFLMQAKVEPGNVNHVQISPTLQATRSNYTRIHGGRSPAYIEYFKKATAGQILLDQLQSEQGARFYRKRNRNMIVKVVEDVPLLPDFQWMTFGQIKKLMRHDNVVNMDTRTVLSGLSFVHPGDDWEKLVAGQDAEISHFGALLLDSEARIDGVRTMDDILHWITELKSKYELVVDKIQLKDVDEWLITEDEIVRPDRKFFRVIGVNVEINNREVASWCQPLVEPMQEGSASSLAECVVRVLDVLYEQAVAEDARAKIRLYMSPGVVARSHAELYARIPKPTL